MHVRITTYNLDPNYSKNARAFAEIFKHRLEKYDGFVSIEFLYNKEKRTGKSIEKWETQELAETAVKVFSSSLDSAAKGIGTGVYTIDTFSLHEVDA